MDKINDAFPSSVPLPNLTGRLDLHTHTPWIRKRTLQTYHRLLKGEQFSLELEALFTLQIDSC